MPERATLATVVLLLGIALLGIAMRVFILCGPVHLPWDTVHRYIPLARNITQYREFSIERGVPDTFDQPLLPFVVSLFREHWKLFVVFQLVLELAMMAAVWSIAKSLGGSPLIAVCLMWVSPIFPWWSSFVITEVTTTTLSALLLLSLVRKKWAWSGVLAGLCVLTRGDMALAVAFVLAAAILVHRPLPKQVLLGVALLIATVLPWAIRTYKVAGTPNFITGVSGQTKDSLIQWMDLWADNQAYIEQYWWERPQYFPPEVLPDVGERRAATNAAMAGDWKRKPEFAQLARRCWHQHFLRSLIGARIQRPFVAWATVVPGSRTRLPLTAEGIALLALSLFALAFASGPCRKLLAIPAALLLGRSGLSFINILGAESRFLVEALPAAFALSSIAICRLFALKGIFSCSAPPPASPQPLRST